MILDFNIIKLNLEKKSSKDFCDGQGVNNVIEYVYKNTPLSEIDFNSFSIEDIETTYVHFSFLPIEEEINDYNDEVELHDPNNCWNIKHSIEEVIVHFINIKNKTYINDDDFI